tara:strand:- start:271 stop:816 length:546 start_codon:yes stop_codon:yes gene_type:complete
MGTIKDFKYKKIKNFLTEDEVILLKKYCIIKHRLNFSNFDMLQNINHDTFFYGDPLMESLMLQKKSLMEKETGLELLPTYSFWRLYSMFATLEKHKDRPSCEISVTIMIDSDKTKWPIYIEGNAVELESGDAVVYLGCDLDHWRNEFLGDYHVQSFLHYVDKNGPNKEWFMDKRPLYGLDK